MTLEQDIQQRIDVYDLRSTYTIGYEAGYIALYAGKAASLRHILEELKHKQGQELIDLCLYWAKNCKVIIKHGAYYRGKMYGYKDAIMLIRKNTMEMARKFMVGLLLKYRRTAADDYPKYNAITAAISALKVCATLDEFIKLLTDKIEHYRTNNASKVEVFQEILNHITNKEKLPVTIEMGKEYYTDAYGPMRILCVDGPDKDYPVSAITKGGMYRTFSLNGECSMAPGNAAYMLKEVKKPQKYRREFWVNVYPIGINFPHGVASTYATKEDAVDAAKMSFAYDRLTYGQPIDTVKIIIEGETNDDRDG